MAGDDRSPFDVLEIPADTSWEEVLKRYRDLAKIYHPDVCPKDASESQRAEWERRYRDIKDAYEKLKEDLEGWRERARTRRLQHDDNSGQPEPITPVGISVKPSHLAVVSSANGSVLVRAQLDVTPAESRNSPEPEVVVDDADFELRDARTTSLDQSAMYPLSVEAVGYYFGSGGKTVLFQYRLGDLVAEQHVTIQPTPPREQLSPRQRQDAPPRNAPTTPARSPEPSLFGCLIRAVVAVTLIFWLGFAGANQGKFWNQHWWPCHAIFDCSHSPVVK